jgi:hypothetical protein
MTARNATKSAFVLYPIFAILRRLSAAEDADGKKRETQASKMQIMVRRLLIAIYLSFLAVVVSGCGTTKGQVATEQMVVSDAVDRSVASINFRRLAGKRVYLDTQYMKSVKGPGFVNSDYIVSSLRQQMVAAGCRLEEKPDEADYIVEARVGALGTDQHDVTYGIPASTALSSAASLVPNAPAIPLIRKLPLPNAMTRWERPRSRCSPTTDKHVPRSGNPAWPKRGARQKTSGCSVPVHFNAARCTTSSNSRGRRFRCHC